MSLVIPPEFAKLINRYSGYIDSKSPYSKKNLKGLFRTSENQKYLAKQVYSLITNRKFIEMTVTDLVGEEMAFGKVALRLKLFGPKKQFLESIIPQMTEVHVLPYNEELMVANPIMQLSRVNGDFIKNTSRNIIQNPDMLVPGFYEINPETGIDESEIEYDFTSASYADGSWHPEHLFTNSHANKRSGYWRPVDVSVFSDSDNTGLGHRYYNNGAYSYVDYGNQRSRAEQGLAINEASGSGLAFQPYVGDSSGVINQSFPSGSTIGHQPPNRSRETFVGHVGNRREMLMSRNNPKSGARTVPARQRQGVYFGSQKGRSQFPKWQDAGSNRAYEKNIDETLEEGGHSDRRIQRNRGYDMRPLTSRSTY